MTDSQQPADDPDLIDSGTAPTGRSGSSALTTLRVFGRWLVRRRTPLVVIPLVALLIIVSSIGARMLLEAIPEPESTPPPTICWDASEVATAEECSLPTGEAGLRWVFPSFDPESENCRNLLEGRKNSPRPTAWQCDTVTKSGVLVQVNYLELASAKGGRIYYQKQFKGAERTAVEDRQDQVFRYEWRQRTELGFQLATVYKDFPFAVVVNSRNAAFRDKIFKSQVRFRQPKGVTVRRYAPGADPDETASSAPVSD